jgi:hypothetical protein
MDRAELPTKIHARGVVDALKNGLGLTTLVKLLKTVDKKSPGIFNEWASLQN